MKKVFSLFALIIIVIVGYAIFNLYSSGELTSRRAESHFVYNYTEQTEVTGRHEHRRLAPASLTKVLTTMISMNSVDDPAQTLSIDVYSYQRMVEEGSSMAGFYGNETITYQDAWMGTLLKSGGETANTLALDHSGTRGDFVHTMNDVALSMGLEDSHFMNPEGLDEEDHYASAYDITMILNNALNSERFREVFTTASYQSSATMDHPDGVSMENKALIDLRNLVQGTRILGVKTGTTPDAGLCLTGLVEKGGTEYLITVMGVPFESYSDTYHYDEFKKLCDAL